MSRINSRAAMIAQPKVFPHPAPAVFVVTDDDNVRECLENCANPADWQAHAFADAKTFLSHSQMPGPACLVLDLDLPDADGLDVQALVRDRREVPVIFIARCPSVRTTVRAIKAGAVEFLAKPLDAGHLLDAVRQAMHQSREVLAHGAQARVLRDRFSSLSPREREVMELVVSGRLNKQVAAVLGISTITVQVHRGRVMRKMRAASFANLVNMAAALHVAMEELPVERGPTQSLVANRGVASSQQTSMIASEEQGEFRAIASLMGGNASAHFDISVTCAAGVRSCLA
jgi:FixJ family two-component response regulator